MLSNIMDVLQGPATEAVDSGEDETPAARAARPKQAGAGAGSDGAGSAAQEPATGGAFSLWGMATALAENVKKGAADIAETVAETDWRSELQTFQHGVEADTQRTAAEARAKSLEAVHSLGSLGALGSLTGDWARVRERVRGSGEGPPADPGGSASADGLDAARVAQSLTQVGTKLRGFGASLLSGTTGLLEKVHDTISAELEGMEDQLVGRGRAAHAGAARAAGGAGSVRYSRLEAEVSAMQRNSGTYCDEPEDAADYAAWLAGFDLAARKKDIDEIAAGNAFMAELQARIVPLIVRYDVFWTRYFYQLHRLQRQHEARQQLAQRARASAQEDAIGWDDDLAPADLAHAAAPGPTHGPASDPSPPAPGAGTPDPAEQGEVEAGLGSSATRCEGPGEGVGESAGGAACAVDSGEGPAPVGSAAAGAEVQVLPPPVAIRPGQVGAAAAAGSSTSSPVRRKEVSPETSTASDDSGAAPWTVVTSPSAASRAAAVAAAAAAAVAAAAAGPSGPAADEAMSPLVARSAAQAAGEGEAEDGVPAEKCPEAAIVGKAPGESATAQLVAAQRQGMAAGAAPVPAPEEEPTAAAATTRTAAAGAGAAAQNPTHGSGHPAKALGVPPVIAEGGEDLEEISDAEGAAAAGGADSDVDEDWGEDWN